MQYVLVTAIAAVFYGIVFNVYLKSTTKKHDTDDIVMAYVIIGACSVFWWISFPLLLIGLCIFIGTKCSNRIALYVVKKIKGNQDAP